MRWAHGPWRKVRDGLVCAESAFKRVGRLGARVALKSGPHSTSSDARYVPNADIVTWLRRPKRESLAVKVCSQCHVPKLRTENNVMSARSIDRHIVMVFAFTTGRSEGLEDGFCV